MERERLLLEMEEFDTSELSETGLRGQVRSGWATEYLQSGKEG